MVRKILLVEDEAILALSEAKMIEKHGFEVEAVYSGEKAVERAVRDPEISLILMDIDLGAGIDGTEAAQKILATRDIPIIFLTSHSEKEYVDKVKKITGYGYVLKNSGEFILIESIHMAYKLFEAKQEAQINLKESEIAYQEMEARDYLLQHVNRVLLSIRNVNQVITKEREEFTLLNKACQLLVETSGYHKAWIVRMNNGVPVAPYYHAGFNSAFQPMEELLRRGHIPSCVRAAIKLGRVQIIRDPSAECPGCPFNQIYKDQSYGYEDKATMTMKLEYDNYLYGWISVILPAFYSDNPDEIKLFREISGDLAYALHHIQVEQQRHRLKHDLKLSQSTLVAALNNSHAGIAIAEAPDGNLRYMNDSALRIFGGERDKIINRVGIEEYASNWQLFDLDGRPLDTDEVPLTRAVRYGETDSRQFIVRRNDQEDRIVMANAAPIFDEIGHVDSGIVIFLDLTDYKQTDLKLRESVEKFQALFEAEADAVLMINVEDGSILEANPAAERMYGYSEDELIGMKVWKLSAEPKKSRQAIKLDDHTDIEVQRYHKKKSGEKMLVKISARYYELQGKRLNISTIRSVTDISMPELELQESEQRRAEDQLRFQGQILEALDEAVIATDLEGQVLYLNSYAEWLYGWSREEAIGMNIMNVTVPEASQQQGHEIMKALSQGKSWSGDFPVHTKEGVEFLAHVTNSPVYSNEGEFIGIIGGSYDVTQQRKTEREKVYLMSELNHRVKNNLALISSLVYLKDSELGDAADLGDLMGQIKAVQMVHAKLFQTNEVTHINVKDYLNDLLDSLFSSLTNLPVTIVCSMENELIETKTAGSIGLIINELATNAIKYGFNSEEEPRFTVELRKDKPDRKYELIVSNTGNPFPENVDIHNSASLGLQLINTLVDQIEGTIQLERCPQPKYTIRFPTETE